MNKLQMANDWYMKHSKSPSFMDTEIKMAWEYADKMQAEADKRKVSGVPDAILNLSNSTELDWQPDWSQAPDGVTSWHMNENKSSYWVIGSGVHLFEDQGKFLLEGWSVREPAPSFDYKGDWKESLRRRP